MPKRKRRTPAQRLAICEAHNWICYLSGQKIDPIRDRYEIEHVIPLAGGGTDDDENCRPVLASAHIEKTKADLARIAKGKRIEQKHKGAKRTKRPMPGSRASGWKHRMNGEWERR
jgi:5-methylcytosine-specific restriction enzyme A